MLDVWVQSLEPEGTNMATTTPTPLDELNPLTRCEVKAPRHRTASTSHVVTATSAVIRVIALTGAAAGLATALSASANADNGTSTLLSEIGIGGNGAVSQAIAQIGVSLCPLFVQPGSQLASTATTASGQGGTLGSQLAGGVAGLAIQSQCPNFMTSLANGDFSVLSNAASMLGMATPAANPLSSITGAATENPLSALSTLTTPGA